MRGSKITATNRNLDLFIEEEKKERNVSNNDEPLIRPLAPLLERGYIIYNFQRRVQCFLFLFRPFFYHNFLSSSNICQ